jgi:hypothetical protein
LYLDQDASISILRENLSDRYQAYQRLRAASRKRRFRLTSPLFMTFSRRTACLDIKLPGGTPRTRQVCRSWLFAFGVPGGQTRQLFAGTPVIWGRPAIPLMPEGLRERDQVEWPDRFAPSLGKNDSAPRAIGGPSLGPNADFRQETAAPGLVFRADTGRWYARCNLGQAQPTDTTGLG